MRHLAIVAAQAGRDLQLDCFPGWTYEPPLGLGAAVQYAFMARQVLRNDGRATAFEIVWCRDDNTVVVGQLAHDEVGVPRDADPNNNIHSPRSSTLGAGTEMRCVNCLSSLTMSCAISVSAAATSKSLAFVSPVLAKAAMESAFHAGSASSAGWADEMLGISSPETVSPRPRDSSGSPALIKASRKPR